MTFAELFQSELPIGVWLNLIKSGVPVHSGTICAGRDAW